jgi:hypothetical protein
MDDIQKKVDILISLVGIFREKTNYLDQNQLSQMLINAIFCLKSHDLIGLDIIKTSIEENIYIKTITDEYIIKTKKQIFQLINEIKQDFAKDEIPISKAEEIFLNLSYNKFFDILSEIYSKKFWEKEQHYRLSKFSQVFSVYSEILNHEPFLGVFDWLKKYRPPMEAEICGSLFKFIRNILVHFPFFDSWNEIWINKELVNWHRMNQSIDRFLKKYCGTPEVKYRFKENSKQGFTYVTIHFPKKYDNERIYLKDIICEEEGIKFILVMMLRVLNTQILSINN